MRLFRMFLVGLACCIPAFAQLESYTITVAASRPLGLQPDQIGMQITVQSASGFDVLGLLQPLGITAANIASVGSGGLLEIANVTNPFSSAALTNTVFAITVPIANITATVSALTKLEASIPAFAGSPTISFSFTGTSLSPQLQNSQQCPIDALVADARAQASTLAQASGFTLGPISAMTYSMDRQGLLNVGTVGYIFLASGQPFLSTSPPFSGDLVCNVSVKFKTSVSTTSQF